MRARLVLAVALELVLLALVPGRKLVALVSGRDVVLRTAPVDPYDLLAGWYTTLSYEAERPDAAKLPADLGVGEAVFVVLAPGEPAWEVVEVVRERPAPSDDRVAVAARALGHGRLRRRGRGRCHLPQVDRDEGAAALRRERDRGLVDVRVERSGAAVVRRLRLGPDVFGAPLL